MTVTVSFGGTQALLDNGSTGVQLAQVILPYSIRNSEDSTKYLGGQMTLFPSDGIKLSDNTKDWERLALAKIKEMVADAEIYAPEPVYEELPESSAVEAPEELPTSSADDSVASSEATVASSSVEASASSVEAPVSSASAAEISEAPVSSSEPTVNSSVTAPQVSSETEAQ